MCVCVCLVKDGKGRKLVIHLFQKTKRWETRFPLHDFLSPPLFAVLSVYQAIKAYFLTYLNFSK